jgi:hypothetical protein
VAYLTTRVRDPGEQDWFKLCKVLGFLKETKDDVLTLSLSNEKEIIWHVDAAFAVHPDMKSHTGATMSLGEGTIQSFSIKQKINTRSSTEAELVALDDVISKIVWTKLFLQEQGVHNIKTVIMRDNQSSMKLENKGKLSSGKRNRHFNIKYFYITDLIEKKEVETRFCTTNNMTADYLTKPVTGGRFHQFRREILNV